MQNWLYRLAKQYPLAAHVCVGGSRRLEAHKKGVNRSPEKPSKRLSTRGPNLLGTHDKTARDIRRAHEHDVRTYLFMPLIEGRGIRDPEAVLGECTFENPLTVYM